MSTGSPIRDVAGPVPAEDAAEPEPPQRWRLDVEVVPDAGAWDAFGPIDVLVRATVAALSAAPELADRPSSVATVVLTTDEAVRVLNAQYRGQDKPTNVLSFPAAGSPPGGPVMLGDVILAEATVLREAGELAIPPSHHLQHLVLHGLLHLAGYDHETEEDAARMEAFETRILARLGIADPYAEPAAGRHDE